MFGFFENKVNELYKKLAPEQTDEERFWSALAAGDVNTAQILMDTLGLNANVRNGNGNTPLHVAAYNGHWDMVQFLLQRGADPLAKGQRSNTTLHYAAAKGHLDLAKLFIDLGVNVLEKNELGKTAYDIADGFGVKQYLMPLMFSEEQRTGTAPRIVGATVDASIERARLANLPPPPKMGEIPQPMAPPAQPMAVAPPAPHQPAENGVGAPAPYVSTGMQQPPSFSPSPIPPAGPVSAGLPPVSSGTAPPPTFQQPPAPRTAAPRTSRNIEPDGFVTTVGNPELAAKYGNRSTYRGTDNGAAGTAAAFSGPPTYNPNIAKQSPFARGRYVTYDAVNNVGGAPMQYSQQPTPGMANPMQQQVAQTQSFSSNGFSNSPTQPLNTTSQQPHPQVHQPFNPARQTSSPMHQQPFNPAAKVATTVSPSSPAQLATPGSPARSVSPVAVNQPVSHSVNSSFSPPPSSPALGQPVLPPKSSTPPLNFYPPMPPELRGVPTSTTPPINVGGQQHQEESTNQQQLYNSNYEETQNAHDPQVSSTIPEINSPSSPLEGTFESISLNSPKEEEYEEGSFN